MSMQINVDPAGLTQEQREAVAGFILAYPGRSCAGSCHTGAEIHDAGVAVLTHVHTAPVASGETGPALDPEIAALVKDDGEFQASVAFGGPAPDPMAAAAFGSAPAPLVPSIPPAPAASTVVLPPPANTAPTTTTPGAASSVAGAVTVELDKHGLPWDGRIHAESKAKNADNTWRRRRNLDPAALAQVEAELRQVMGAPAAAPLVQGASIAPSVPTPPPVTVDPVIANSPTASVSPVVVPPPTVVAPQAPAAGADARQQFVGLVGRASAAIQAGKVTQAEVNQCCADAGVPALPLLANRLDLVAQVAAHVDALIAARQ